MDGRREQKKRICTLTLFVNANPWVYALMQARALETLNPNNATGKMLIKCNFNSFTQALHTEKERESEKLRHTVKRNELQVKNERIKSAKRE